METNINYTIVGAFVIFLIAAIIMGIIWLSSGFSFEKYTNYMLYMQESVSGLSIDSPVEFNGVDVGTVKSIEIGHHNLQQVKVLLSLKSNTPVTQGTVATLNTRGVTGFTYIALKDKGDDLRPLVIRPPQLYGVIKTAPSLFNRLDTALSQLSKNLSQVTQSIQSVLDKDNQQSIKQTLSHLQEVTNILEAQTLPMTYQMLNNLDDMTQSISAVTTEIKRNPAILIRGADHEPLGPGETK